MPQVNKWIKNALKSALRVLDMIDVSKKIKMTCWINVVWPDTDLTNNSIETKNGRARRQCE